MEVPHPLEEQGTSTHTSSLAWCQEEECPQHLAEKQWEFQLSVGRLWET